MFSQQENPLESIQESIGFSTIIQNDQHAIILNGQPTFKKTAYGIYSHTFLKVKCHWQQDVVLQELATRQHIKEPNGKTSLSTKIPFCISYIHCILVYRNRHTLEQNSTRFIYFMTTQNWLRSYFQDWGSSSLV